MTDPKLQNKTKVILALLIGHIDADGRCYRGQKSIAKEMCTSYQAIQNQIYKLKKAGYIRIEPKFNASNGAQQENNYYLNYSLLEINTPTTQLDCRGTTQLDCEGTTLENCERATQLDCPKKTVKKEKEKEAHPRDDFSNDVKREFDKGTFSEIADFDIDTVFKQVSPCWDYWEANKFPEGCYIHAFKGWLRNGYNSGKIKNTAIEQRKNKECEYPNPEQPWHKSIKKIVGEGQYISWFRRCWYDDEGTLYAPNKFHAVRISEEFDQQIKEILPGVKIDFKQYQKTESKEVEYA